LDFGQEKGINGNGTFAPVIKHQSLRLLFAIIVYCELDDEIYIEIPEGLKVDFQKVMF
jgi:hypothetical protein